jgi:hypothetical protein
MLKSGLVNMSNHVQTVTICTHSIVRAGWLCFLLRCASHNYNRFAAAVSRELNYRVLRSSTAPEAALYSRKIGHNYCYEQRSGKSCDDSMSFAVISLKMY